MKKVTQVSDDVVQFMENKNWNLPRLLMIWITSWVNNLISGVLIVILATAKFIILYDKKRKELYEQENARSNR
jgi:ascorbate-specific PTS system EIIC-type component UlaA|tara:strand:+ start:313 stop:531 length:219 start_codon:yes stop_codon:yes gene_type:complete